LLDQYQLIDRIGVGGMAEVWRATMRGAEGFERPVAIKRILPQFSGDTDFVAMFVDEAKIAVRLSHPNIVQIFDLGRAGDEWFIAMELVHGKDLRAVTDAEAARGQRVPLEVACHAVMMVCEGLQHAHFLDANPLQPTAGARQIIHRDISPQNVLVSYDGEVKVTDFGLAKAAGRAAHTQAGTIKGKLAYMSPEQLRGVPLDQRSDVFAVGVVLWELLTGERLFLGQNDRDTIAKAFACKVPPLGTIDPTIDDELDRITRRALSMERDQRYASAEELHDDLEAYVYGAGLTLSSGSLAAYMRALFPQAEPAPARKRDRRAVTAQIQLEDAPVVEEPIEELDGLLDDAALLESEPAPRMRSYLPAAAEAGPSSIPLSASDLPSELSDHDIDALEESIQYILGTGGQPPADAATSDGRSASRSALSAPALPSIPPQVAVAPPPTRASDPGRLTSPRLSEPDASPTMYDPDAVYPELDAARAALSAQLGAAAPTPPAAAAPRDEPPSLDHPWGDDHGFDHDEGTLAFEGRFGDEDEQTPQFDVELARASIDATHDDPDRTVMPADDAEYAAMAARATNEEADDAPVGPAEEMLITRMVRPSASDLQASRERDLGDESAVAPVAGPRSSQTMPTARPPGAPAPADARKPYAGFEDGEDDTTTGAGTPRGS
jgi:eukaryotic-like serine/threonine-protein kinase